MTSFHKTHKGGNFSAARLRIGIVGATGLVGQELIRLLQRRRFPVGELLPFSSGRTQSSVHFRGKNIPAPAVSLSALKQCSLVFFVSSDEVSRRYAPALVRAGTWVIDDSSAFRLHPDVPLVIPEVNACALTARRRLIAGPNCTLTGAAVAGQPLIRAAGAKSIHIASYQAVSGAGKDALKEFLGQLQTLCAASYFSMESKGGDLAALESKLKFIKSAALPRPIAFNVIPQVGAFAPDGFSTEETKVIAELRKILSLPRLPISVTAVRVPVLRGHSLALWIETRRKLSIPSVRKILHRMPGLKLWPGNNYPTSHQVQNTFPVHVGRVRKGGGEKEICLWVVSDNLWKGAALNSIQIAETLLRRGWLKQLYLQYPYSVK